MNLYLCVMSNNIWFLCRAELMDDARSKAMQRFPDAVAWDIHLLVVDGDVNAA